MEVRAALLVGSAGRGLQASTGSSNSSKTNFLWDVSFGLPQIARENSGNGSLQRRYVYGERRISLANSSATTYYHYDPLGSVANMTSSSGSTLWTYSYEPFGTTRVETSNSGPANFMKFTGEYLDPSGLYHLRARQYDPVSGRFLRPDPLDPGAGLALIASYVYAADRPTVMVDPSGETFRPAQTGQRIANFTTSVVSPDVGAACQAELCGKRRVSLVHPIPRGFSGYVGGRHNTGDLPGYPAFDFFFPQGTPVVAVERGEIRLWGGSQQGVALYLRGDSGFDYWYGHLEERFVSPGSRVRLGQRIGRIGRFINTEGKRADHVHLGVNTNVGGKLNDGRGRIGVDDPKNLDWQLGREVMSAITRSSRVR